MCTTHLATVYISIINIQLECILPIQRDSIACFQCKQNQIVNSIYSIMSQNTAKHLLPVY